jgi:transposase
LTLPAQPGLICLEATGSYSDAICSFLEQQGYPLAVLNPAVLVAYRKSKNLRRKTDKQDAMLLACYAQDNDARLRRTLWHPFSQPVLALRYLLN